MQQTSNEPLREANAPASSEGSAPAILGTEPECNVNANAERDGSVINAPMLKTATFRRQYLHISKESTGEKGTQVSMQQAKSQQGHI